MPRARKPSLSARCAEALPRAQHAERDRERLEKEKSLLLRALNLTMADADLVRKMTNRSSQFTQQSGTRLAIDLSLRIRSQFISQ